MTFEWPGFEDEEDWYRGEVTDEGKYIRFKERGDTDAEPIGSVKCSTIGSPDEFAYIYPGSKVWLASEPGPDGYSLEFESEPYTTDDDPEIRTDGGVEESDNERWIHPLERLKEKAEEAAERREKEVVSCPECGTEVLKESFDDAVETAINHDEKRHDGAGVTRINGMDVPSDDLAEVVEDAIQHLSTDNRPEESP